MPPLQAMSLRGKCFIYYFPMGPGKSCITFKIALSCVAAIIFVVLKNISSRSRRVAP